MGDSFDHLPSHGLCFEKFIKCNSLEKAGDYLLSALSANRWSTTLAFLEGAIWNATQKGKDRIIRKAKVNTQNTKCSILSHTTVKLLVMQVEVSLITNTDVSCPHISSLVIAVLHNLNSNTERHSSNFPKRTHAYSLKKRSKKWPFCPGWCGLAGWSIVHTPKRCRFNPRLGHIWEGTNRCFLSIFSPSLSLSLKSINIF